MILCHQAFLDKVDKATRFTTKSVLCVVLNNNGGSPAKTDDARAVVQLINKLGEGGSGEGAFEAADAERVRDEVSQPCESSAVNTTTSNLSVPPLASNAASRCCVPTTPIALAGRNEDYADLQRHHAP